MDDPETPDLDPRIRRRLERARGRRRDVGVDHAVVVAYEGRAYSGYARQPERRTVEGDLHAALCCLAPGVRRWGVAGRTDRGVSARAQVVSFRADASIDPARIEAAIDRIRPGALLCRSAQLAPRGFHAQFWAVERGYTYDLPADAAAMELVPRLDALLAPLVGTRSFRAFARETPPGRSEVRTLRRARCRLAHVDEAPVVRFELDASGFLRRMVRVLVASALEAARARAPPDALLALAETEDRTRTAHPAPPEPLTLARVVYRGWAPLGAELDPEGRADDPALTGRRARR